MVATKFVALRTKIVLLEINLIPDLEKKELMNIDIKTVLPGPLATKEMQIFEKFAGLVQPSYPFIYSSGEGCYVKDIDGNTFLDMASQICVAPLGYGHPRIREVIRKYSDAAQLKLAGHDFYSKEHADLISRLVEITPRKMDSVFLINSGAEAVENAMKICFRQRPSAKVAISFQGAFHGRTLGALSLTNNSIANKRNYPEIPVRRISYDMSGVEELERIIAEDIAPENVAFVIIEPIQGEGGYVIPEADFMQAVRKVTKNNGIPLIDDEVQMGLGRTGKWWAAEHFGIEGDIITSAKALQVGATITSKDLFPQEGGAISSTYGGGSLLDMAIGLEIINTIEDEHLLSNAEKIGGYVLKQLKELEEENDAISNARGMGLVLAIDLPNKEFRDKVVMENYKNGLLTLCVGRRSLRLLPPYIVSENEIDEARQVIERSIKAVSQG